MKDIVQLSENLLETERVKKDPEMQEERRKLTKQAIKYKTTVENINELHKGNLDEICYRIRN